MSTQDKSPVTSLMEGLGIGTEEATQTDVESQDKDLTLDSDKPTQMDGDNSEPTVETDPSEESDDTVNTGELETLRAELEKANKRISDKDRYINELKQGKQQGEDATAARDDFDTDDGESFWDDPEANYKKLMNQLQIANLRIDENAYAMKHSDYYDIVNGEALKEAFDAHPEFLNDFNNSNRKYETAYKFLKANMETKQMTAKQQQEKLESEIRAKVLAELGISNDTPKKQVPPNMRSLGSASNAKQESSADGFASVFGGF